MNSNALQNKKILVVDDEDFLREVLVEIFNTHGAFAVAAENGTFALEKLKADRFDVVISDIRMPGGDGVSLVENIDAQLTYRPKIFLCSGFNDIPADKVASLNVVEIFAKPFSVDKLVESVSKSLQN